MDSATLASKLSAYDANPVTSTKALNDAMAQYGVPELRTTVSGLRTTLANSTNAYNNVDPSVTGRTSGSLVTEAQREKQVANERAPIADQIKTETGALSDQGTALNDALTQASTQATNKVNDYNTGRAALEAEYQGAYQREQDAKSADLEKQKLAEQVREANLSAKNNGGGTQVDPAAGYKVRQRSDKSYGFSGPNGSSNMYQYASAMSGGDPQGTYNTIKQLLKGGTAKDVGAYNGIVRLEKQGLSMDQIIGRLKASNAYIFN